MGIPVQLHVPASSVKLADILKENLNYSLYFNIKNFKGNKYIINFKSKESNVESIRNFISILQKLIYLYNNSGKAAGISTGKGIGKGIGKKRRMDLRNS